MKEKTSRSRTFVQLAHCFDLLLSSVAIVDPLDRLLNMLCHHDLVLRYVIYDPRCGHRNEVAKHLIVGLLSIFYLQKPIEKLFILGIGVVKESLIVKDRFVVNDCNVILVVKEQINDQVIERLSKLLDAFLGSLLLVEHGRVFLFSQSCFDSLK